MLASGVLQFAEDLRVEYGIGVSGGDVSRSSTMTERNTDLRQDEEMQEQDEDEDEDEEMVDDGDADSDTTIILEDAEPEEVEAPDTSEANKENVPEVTPVSPPVSTAEPTPSPPPEPLDPFRRAVEDFEALKVAACIDSGEDIPIVLYLGLVLALLSMCANVTVLSLPVAWRALIGEKVKGMFPRLKELRWTVDMGEDEVETFGEQEEEWWNGEEDEDLEEEELDGGEEEGELEVGEVEVEEV
jgi:hypothetical protein